MPAIQTQYDYYHTAGRPGLVFGTGQDNVVNAYEAAQDIPFGRAVYISSDAVDRTKRKISLGTGKTVVSGTDVVGDNVVGISIRDVEKTGGKYVAGDMVPVLERGKIWTEMGNAVAKSGIRLGIFPNGSIGSFTNTSNVKNKNIISLGKSSANDLVVVQVLGLDQIDNS